MSLMQLDALKKWVWAEVAMAMRGRSHAVPLWAWCGCVHERRSQMSVIVRVSCTERAARQIGIL